MIRSNTIPHRNLDTRMSFDDSHDNDHEQNMTTIVQVHTDELATQLDDSFTQLLTQLGIDNHNKIVDLLHEYSLEDKQRYLQLCHDVVHPTIRFTRYDESLLSTLDSDHTIDCITILTLKHRILHGSVSWLRAFCGCEGVSVLIENIDNCLQYQPMIVSYHALYELILCLRHILSQAGLDVITKTRGALNACVMALTYEHVELMIKLLELLNAVCVAAKSSAIAMEITLAMHQLSIKLREKKPFSFLVEGIQHPDHRVRYAMLLFLNNWIMKCDRSSGLQIRLLLARAGVVEALKFYGEHCGDLTNVVPLAEDENAPSAPAPLLRRASSAVEHIVRATAINDSGYMLPEVDPNSLLYGIDLSVYDVELTNDRLTLTLHANTDEVYDQLESDSDEDSDEGIQAMMPQSLTAVFPVATIKRVVNFSTNAEIQAMFEYFFTVEMKDGSKLHFGFERAEQSKYAAWLSSLEVAMINKRADLSAWSHVVPHSTVASQLYLNQIDLWNGILKMDASNINGAMRPKKKFTDINMMFDYLLYDIEVMPESERKVAFSQHVAAVICGFDRDSHEQLEKHESSASSNTIPPRPPPPPPRSSIPGSAAALQQRDRVAVENSDTLPENPAGPVTASELNASTSARVMAGEIKIQTESAWSGSDVKTTESSDFSTISTTVSAVILEPECKVQETLALAEITNGSPEMRQVTLPPPPPQPPANKTTAFHHQTIPQDLMERNGMSPAIEPTAPYALPPRRQHELPVGRKRTNVSVSHFPKGVVAKSLFAEVQEIDLQWETVDALFSQEAAIIQEGTAIQAPVQDASVKPINPMLNILKQISTQMRVVASMKTTPSNAGAGPSVFKFPDFDRYEIIRGDIADQRLVPVANLRQEIIDLEPAKLTPVKTRVLLRMLPTDQEMAEIEGQKGDQMEDIAQIFVMLSKIPRYAERLEFHNLMFSLGKDVEATIDKISNSIAIINASTDLVNYAMTDIKVYMQYAVSVINYLNAGQPNAKAVAVSLEKLIELKKVYTCSKSKPRNYSVLHLIDELMTQSKITVIWENLDLVVLSSTIGLIFNPSTAQDSLRKLILKTTRCLEELRESQSYADSYPELFQSLVHRLAPVQDFHDQLLRCQDRLTEMLTAVMRLNEAFCIVPEMSQSENQGITSITQLFQQLVGVIKVCTQVRQHNKQELVAQGGDKRDVYRSFLENPKDSARKSDSDIFNDAKNQSELSLSQVLIIAITDRRKAYASDDEAYASNDEAYTSDDEEDY